MIPVHKKRNVDAGIRVVSASSLGGQGTSLTVNCPAPANIVAGNLLYAFVVCDDTNQTAATVQGDSGVWTLHQSLIFSTHNNSGYILGFYKWATSSEPSTYNWFGATADAMSVVTVQLSGVNPTTPFNTAGTKLTGSATTAAFPKLTITSDKVAILAGAAQAGNFNGTVGNVLTWGSGFTLAGSCTSQYNQGSTNNDSEAIFVGLNRGVSKCGYTTPSVVWNKAYYNGTIAVALNHA